MTRALIERFIEHSPMTLMARLALQGAVDPEWIADVLGTVDGHNSLQIRESLLSMTVEMMSLIAGRVRHPLSEAANPASELPMSVTALHDRISRIQSGWGRALVRESVQRLIYLVQPLRLDQPSLVSGYRLRVLDASLLAASGAGSGHCSPGLAGCVHTSAMPLGDSRDIAPSGQPLVIYDPDVGMIVDLVPYEHGAMNERVVRGALLDLVQPGELWMLDRRFSTRSMLTGWPRSGSAFIVQEHGCTLDRHELEPLIAHERTERGQVFEQTIRMTDDFGASVVFRRIELRPDDSAAGSDKVISILTNVPASHMSAGEVVGLSCRRWSETLRVPVEPVFSSEILSLGQPRAALLTFAVAALAYNVLSAMVFAVSSTQELDERELDRLPAHIAAGVKATYAGMMIALPGDFWERYDQLVPSQLGRIFKKIAAHVDPRSLRKQRREPKASPVTRDMLRAATLDVMLFRDGEPDLDGTPLAEQRATAMATRDFSSNPSKALRDAADSPVMVTKYGQAIAFLISVEDWNRMKAELRENNLDRVTVEYAGGYLAAGSEPAGKSSLN